jgi:hypothetical protein
VALATDNPFYRWERISADLIADWINAARDLRDGWIEWWFHAIYSSPSMRAVGATEAPRISDVAGTDLRAVTEVRQALAQITRGNYAVAVIRMLILLARSRKSVRRDRLERSNELLTAQEPFASLGEAARTRIIHQQSLIVEFEPERALATLPALVPDAKERARAVKQCEFVTGTADDMAPETRALFERMLDVLGLPRQARARSPDSPTPEGSAADPVRPASRSAAADCA